MKLREAVPSAGNCTEKLESVAKGESIRILEAGSHSTLRSRWPASGTGGCTSARVLTSTWSREVFERAPDA